MHSTSVISIQPAIIHTSLQNCAVQTLVKSSNRASHTARLLPTCSTSLPATYNCKRNASSTEISNQPISFSLPTTTLESQTLVSQSRLRLSPKAANTMWEVLSTWLRNLSKRTNTLTRQIFGLLESFSMKCCSRIRLGEPRTKRNCFVK